MTEAGSWVKEMVAQPYFLDSSMLRQAAKGAGSKEPTLRRCN